MSGEEYSPEGYPHNWGYLDLNQMNSLPIATTKSWCPRQELNLGLPLRRRPHCPLYYGGKSWRPRQDLHPHYSWFEARPTICCRRGRNGGVFPIRRAAVVMYGHCGHRTRISAKSGAPTRNSTWCSSFAGKRDMRFTIGAKSIGRNKRTGFFKCLAIRPPIAFTTIGQDSNLDLFLDKKEPNSTPTQSWYPRPVTLRDLPVKSRMLHFQSFEGIKSGAASGNRTRVLCLGSRCSAIEP